MEYLEALKVVHAALEIDPAWHPRVVRRADGSYVVAVPASETVPNLWFVVDHYHTNVHEDLDYMARVPDVVRLNLSI